jgi:hypothetical protein
MKGRKALRAALLALSLTGCDLYYYKIPSPDDLWHVIPWFDHMITARYIRPYETAELQNLGDGGDKLPARTHRVLIGARCRQRYRGSLSSWRRLGKAARPDGGVGGLLRQDEYRCAA